jgi:tRNA(Ile)-lysidine synthase
MPLIVGVSGGPDSVCLLHVLAGLREEMGRPLHIAHLNHNLRGKDAEVDAEYVAQLSATLGLPITIDKRDVAAHQAENRLSLEEAAREVRYQFFAEVAQAAGTDQVAVGHTADDSVETLLMNLMRGTGVGGLKGLQPLSVLRTPSGVPLTVVRPLLEVDRAETEAYCREHDLSPRPDPSNLSPRFLRNRIRHELLPWLRGCNPNVGSALLTTAEILREVEDFLHEQLAPVWNRVVTEEGDHLLLDNSAISSLHPALQRLVFREVFRYLLGDLKDIESKHVEKAREALVLPAGKRLTLPKGVTFYVEYGRCLVGTDRSPEPSLPPLEGERTIQVPGCTAFPGWQVETRIENIGELPWAEGSWSDPSATPGVAYFDFETVGDRVTVRGRRPGDRFQPLGMSQPKKLQDFMVDAHIPRALRDRVPLICSSDHILWVMGWRIDERAKVREGTKQILCVEFQRIDNRERSHA